jgi:hypothetical protein
VPVYLGAERLILRPVPSLECPPALLVTLGGAVYPLA